MAYVDLATLFTPVPRAIVPATWAAQIRENFEAYRAGRREVCTSSTRPTGTEGLEIYETDTDLVYVYSGSAWVLMGRLGLAATWTPTLTQSGSVTKATNIANYWQTGRRCVGELHLTAGGAGGGATDIAIGMPVTMNYSGSPSIAIGSGFVFDASTGTWYSGVLIVASTTTCLLSVHNSLDQIGSSPALTLASSDQISCYFGFQTAS